MNWNSFIKTQKPAARVESNNNKTEDNNNDSLFLLAKDIIPKPEIKKILVQKSTHTHNEFGKKRKTQIKNEKPKQNCRALETWPKQQNR
jgi:hypothetical protein